MNNISVFKAVNICIKLLMFLLSVGFALLCFAGGYFMTNWYPTFTDLRIGAIMMVLSFVLFVFSLLIFKKKNFSSIVLVISMALLIYGAFVYNEGFGNEADLFIIAFVVMLLCLSCVSKLIERKLGRNW